MKRNIDIGHNMKHLFQVLFLLLFCYACSSSEKQQQPKDFIEINMVPLIEGEAQKIPLQEWAKSVRFIPLETNEDILIKHIEDVFQRGDTLLVRHWERLSAFDMNGKYLYDIGSKGPGPEEFTNARFVRIHNDLIYVLESANRIKAYDWKGKFIKKITLPSKAYDVLTVPGNEDMLVYVANHSGEEAVRFYRVKGEEVLDTVFNPFIYKLPENVNWKIDFKHEFQCSAGSLRAFIELGSDTVYRVDENLQTRPYIVFNMGKHLYTREQRYSETSDEWADRVLEGNQCYMTVSGEIEDKVYIYNDREQVKRRTIPYIGDTYCYDKTTKETNKYFLTYGVNDWSILPDASFMPRTILSDKYLVDWEQPDNDENPVLILVEP